MKAILLAGVLTAAAITAAGTAVLSAALARAIDPYRYCETGFSNLVDCNYHWSSTTTGQSDPVITSPNSAVAPDVGKGPRLTSVDVTAWAVAKCPANDIAVSFLCNVPSAATPVRAASDDLATGLPRPSPWLMTTAKNSPFIEAMHVETPLTLAGVLAFYRVELAKRGWTENGGAAVDLDRAVVEFTTSDGQAQLRLARQTDRTIVDLSRRKLVTQSGIVPRRGQVRLLLGNASDGKVAITINGQSTSLVAGAGADLMDDFETAEKSKESQEIELQPGKYKVTLNLATGAAQNREFDVAANETWGLLASSIGILIPLRLD
jgi:hypothetical protein